MRCEVTPFVYGSCRTCNSEVWAAALQGPHFGAADLPAQVHLLSAVKILGSWSRSSPDLEHLRAHLNRQEILHPPAPKIPPLHIASHHYRSFAFRGLCHHASADGVKEVVADFTLGSLPCVPFSAFQTFAQIDKTRLQNHAQGSKNACRACPMVGRLSLEA
jgi:hypothetical protein